MSTASKAVAEELGDIDVPESPMPKGKIVSVWVPNNVTDIVVFYKYVMPELAPWA